MRRITEELPRGRSILNQPNIPTILGDEEYPDARYACLLPRHQVGRLETRKATCVKLRMRADIRIIVHSRCSRARLWNC
eukprot:1391663-Pyramimonas_sp.AAC.1